MGLKVRGNDQLVAFARGSKGFDNGSRFVRKLIEKLDALDAEAVAVAAAAPPAGAGGAGGSGAVEAQHAAQTHLHNDQQMDSWQGHASEGSAGNFGMAKAQRLQQAGEEDAMQIDDGEVQSTGAQLNNESADADFSLLCVTVH